MVIVDVRYGFIEWSAVRRSFDLHRIFAGMLIRY
jgi:hypothetical protein